MTGITEKAVQNALWFTLQSAGASCPNYTPRHWYECDVYTVTKAGYGVEHEVKLTVADFRADCRKQQSEWNGKFGAEYGTETVRKHERLASADPLGPSRFWYVLPHGLIDVAVLPEWAGLKVFDARAGRVRRLRIVKDAPKLHRKKADAAVVSHMEGVFYYRYWRQRVRTSESDLLED